MTAVGPRAPTLNLPAGRSIHGDTPMILLTRMNHDPVVINAGLIVFVESTPDTLVTMANGSRVHVRESVSEVIDRAVHYHQRIHGGAPAVLKPDEAAAVSAALASK